MFSAGLSNAAKTAIDAASAGSLELGNWKLGSDAGDVLGPTATTIPNVVSTFTPDKIKWASFGTTKLNLYLEVVPTGIISVGSMMLFLADNTTPLAYGRFANRIVLYPPGPNMAADRMTLCISLRRAALTSKFDIPVEQSLNFAVPTFTTFAQWEAAKDNSGMIRMQEELNYKPALMFWDQVSWLNDDFFPSGEDPLIAGGGEVGDNYQ